MSILKKLTSDDIFELVINSCTDRTINLDNELKMEFESQTEKLKLKQGLLDFSLMWAASKNNWTVIEIILISPYLHKHADINSNQGAPLRFACCRGSMKALKFLTSSPKLKTHSDTHIENDYAFRLACEYGHFKIIKYLLSDKFAKTDIYAHNDQESTGFTLALKKGHKEIIDYFIHELSYKVSPEELVDMKVEIEDKKLINKVLGDIAKRDLFVKIDEDLDLPTKSPKARKI